MRLVEFDRDLDVRGFEDCWFVAAQAFPARPPLRISCWANDDAECLEPLGLATGEAARDGYVSLIQALLILRLLCLLSLKVESRLIWFLWLGRWRSIL